MERKAASGIMLTLLAISMLALTFNIPSVKSITATQVSVVPSEVSLMVGSSTTINVTITNVANLFAWQVELFFDKTVLNTTTASIWLPPDHVFAGREFVPLEPVVQDYTPENPLYPYRYLFLGASLYSPPLFTGSGTLFQVNFKGVGLGASPLNLTMSPPGLLGVTLLDYNLNFIPFTVKNGRIAVSGPSEPIVNITVDKPYPQIYHYSETMHIKIIIKNSLPTAKDVIFVWYAWPYSPYGPLIPLVLTSYTVPANTIQTFDFSLPCIWVSLIWANWIVAIVDPATMKIISLDYVLWYYTPI